MVPGGRVRASFEAAKESAGEWTREVALLVGRRLDAIWNYGTPVWKRTWDLLIVLDACRWDLFREVAPEYGFLPDKVETTYSPASMSEEWLEVHTAEQYTDELRQTALLSGNINTHWKSRFRDSWGYLDEVWRHSWDDREGTVPATAITDATIDYIRNRAEDNGTQRTIAWYFQPHRPFVPVDWSDGFTFDRLTTRDRDLRQRNEFKLYRDGEITREQLWRGYAANLRYVLDSVEVLLRNVDVDRAVVTSDHGNLLGECNVYEHPRDFPHPALRRVPWVTVPATDMGAYSPLYDRQRANLSSDEIRDRLKHLGYQG